MDVGVEKPHPRDERWAKSKMLKDKEKQRPIDFVKILLLIQGQDGGRSARLRRVINNIS